MTVTAAPRHLWLRLFLPFAAGYLLSYLYRTSNAVIGPVLARELALTGQALGLLTSTYFLTFGAAQLPLGMLLDRFGPRRIEAGLLLFAAAGAAVFARAADLAGLAFGRALIGLGVAACLMAAFTSFNRWFKPDQQTAAAGWILASGGLGALVAAQPLAALLGWIGWRDAMLVLAALTVAVAALIWRAVPDHPDHRVQSARGGWRAQWAGMLRVMTHRQFWRYAPMAAACIGGFMAIQGLWVARWSAEIEALPPAAVAQRLTAIGVAVLAGCLVMGFLTTPLQRRGIPVERMLNADAVVSVLAFAGINFLSGSTTAWLWAGMGLAMPMLNISYSILALRLPPQVSGRANTALNLAVFVGAFGIQSGMGAAVDALRACGWDSAQAYRAGFATVLALQIAAVAWMLVPRSGRPAQPDALAT